MMMLKWSLVILSTDITGKWGVAPQDILQCWNWKYMHLRCGLYLRIYPGSPTTIFYRLLPEPPFFIVRFIIFQKEPPFFKWWLTSRVYIYTYFCCSKCALSAQLVLLLGRAKIDRPRKYENPEKCHDRDVRKDRVHLPKTTPK